MSALLELSDIKKSFMLGKKENEILHGIDLTVEEGDLLAIMGHSGSGKSTLMNIIGLLDRPTSGKYILEGKEVDALDDDELSELRNTTIGFVFQQFLLLPRLSAIQNVTLPLSYRNTPKKESNKICKAMLDKVGMGEYMHHKPSELSGGQQQRVAIARALAGSPKILLADEPTGALDSKTSDEVMEIFIDLNKKSKTTTIIITHDPDVAKQCERTVYMKDGKLVEEK